MRPELKVIERDKNGFATDECLEHMRQALPILVRVERPNWFSGYEYIAEDNWSNFVGDIETDTDMKYYFKCPNLEQIED